MDGLISLAIFIGLIAVGYTYGRKAESEHYRSIERREQEFLRLPAVPMRHALDENAQIADAQLVTGSVAISVDYFKRMLAGLRNIFGGRMSSYESLVDRARREAVLRMKEAAQGANIIVNLRIETSTIGQRAGRDKSVGSIEAIAYGTAVTYKS